MAAQAQYKFEEDEEDAFDTNMDFGVQQAGYEPGQYNEAESRTLRPGQCFLELSDRGGVPGASA